MSSRERKTRELLKVGESTGQDKIYLTKSTRCVSIFFTISNRWANNCKKQPVPISIEFSEIFSASCKLTWCKHPCTF